MARHVSCIIDCFADYKKLKGLDVIGTLISLFETKDVFVKEFQAILGARLLKNDLDLNKEVIHYVTLRFRT